MTSEVYDNLCKQHVNLKISDDLIRLEEMHKLRHEMRDRFASLETRVTAVEVKLRIVEETRKALYIRFMDCCFKPGWLALGALLSYVALQLHILCRGQKFIEKK